MLVRQLPRDSATARAQHGPWGTNEHLLAHVANLLAAGNWQRGGGKGRRPVPIRPPGADGRQHFGKARPLDDEAREMYRQWKAGELATPA